MGNVLKILARVMGPLVLKGIDGAPLQGPGENYSGFFIVLPRYSLALLARAEVDRWA